jgi:PAS domain S-box-containing protein
LFSQKDQTKTKEHLVKELADCRQRVTELEVSEAEHKRAEEALRKSEERYRAFLAATTQVVWTTNAAGEVVEDLPTWRDVTGQSVEAIKGWGWIEAVHPDDRERAAQVWTEAVRAKSLYENEFRVRKRDGSYRLFLARAIPVLEEDGSIREWVGTLTDITERKQAEEIITRQARELLETSTPVLQVWEGVVVAPLIGVLDSQRTQRFMEVLLGRIVETKSALALVDITGVPTIDTQTAYHLIETISAVRLLGAQVLLTGVSPAIAQTLVHLGIDLSGITTRSSLVAGLRVALDKLGLQMVSKK